MLESLNTCWKLDPGSGLVWPWWYLLIFMFVQIARWHRQLGGLPPPLLATTCGHEAGLQCPSILRAWELQTKLNYSSYIGYLLIELILVGLITILISISTKMYDINSTKEFKCNIFSVHHFLTSAFNELASIQNTFGSKNIQMSTPHCGQWSKLSQSTFWCMFALKQPS